MNSKLDLDLTTVLRYIDSSWLPSHFEICRKMIDNYSKLHELDIYGTAMLVDALEMKAGYSDDFYS